MSYFLVAVIFAAFVIQITQAQSQNQIPPQNNASVSETDEVPAQLNTLELDTLLDFQRSLDAALANAITQLDADPLEIDSALKGIANSIFVPLQAYMLTVIELGAPNAVDITTNLISALEDSLENVAKSGVIGGLDIDGAISLASRQITYVLGQEDAFEGVDALTVDITNTLVVAVGNGFSQVLGVPYTFRLQGGQIIWTDINGAVAILKEDLQQQNFQKVIQEFSRAAADPMLQPYLTASFVVILQDKNFPYEEFLAAVAVASQKENIVPYLSQAISFTLSTSNHNGVIALKQQGITGRNLTAGLTLNAIEGVILNHGGCSQNVSTSLVIAKGMGQAAKNFKDIVAQNEVVHACLLQGELMIATLQIEDYIKKGEIENAYSVVQTSDASAITAASFLTVNQGFEKEVLAILQNLFQDPNITTYKIVNTINLLVSQDQSSIVLGAISMTLDLAYLIDAFTYAFTEAIPDVRNAFIQLVSQSIGGGRCSLEDLVEGVLEGASRRNRQLIIQSLLEGKAFECIPEQFFPSDAVPDQEEFTVVSTTSSPQVILINGDDQEPKGEPLQESAVTKGVAIDSPPALQQSNDAIPSEVDEEEGVPNLELPSQFLEEPLLEMNPSPLPAVVVISQSPTIMPSTDQILSGSPSLSTSTLPPPSPFQSPLPSPSPSMPPNPPPSPQPSPSPTPTSTDSSLPTSPPPQVGVDTSFECVDIAPPSGYTCEEQAKFGKCVRRWMFNGGFCAKTCGFCERLAQQQDPNFCSDLQPDNSYTCEEQKQFGKCQATWMIERGYCKKTCGNCEQPPPPPPPPPPQTVETPKCYDIQPDEKFTCAQQKEFGKCKAAWMVQGGFCAKTCDLCPKVPQFQRECDDIQPDNRYTCKQQKEFGKCQTTWMLDGGYCRRTCGQCSYESQEELIANVVENVFLGLQQRGQVDFGDLTQEQIILAIQQAIN